MGFKKGLIIDLHDNKEKVNVGFDAPDTELFKGVFGHKKELLKDVRFADATKQAEQKILLQKQFSQLRNEVLKTGLNLDREIGVQKLKSQERAAVLSSASKLAMYFPLAAFTA